jgi:uncharacterized protein (DUF58 family)
MRIRRLDLRARRVVEGFYNGLHRSPYHGFSVEFSQYRPYTSGDDLRGVDWKLFARTDRYHIKQFEDETSRRCYLVVDQSASMRYGTLAYDKAEYARTIAATLAYYFTLQRDSVGLVTFADEVTDFLPARHRPGHFRRLLSLLDKPFDGRQTELNKPLERIAALVRRRGLVILISDMLSPLDALQQHLSHLTGRGHEVMVLRVLDPGEIDFTLTGPAMVRDLESGREVYIDPASAAAQYRAQFTAHEDQLRSACDQLGIHYERLVTDAAIEDALYALIHHCVYRRAAKGVR